MSFLQVTDVLITHRSDRCQLTPEKVISKKTPKKVTRKNLEHVVFCDAPPKTNMSPKKGLFQ